MSVNLLSLKWLIFWGPFFNISCQRKACHFTSSSKPCKGLAVCKAKVVPSMFSHFKTVSIDQTHNLPTELYYSRKFRAILLSYLNEVLEQLNTYLHTTSHFERFLHYVIKYDWFYKLMSDAAFQWLLRKLSWTCKKWASYYNSTRKLVNIPCCLHQRSTASLGLMVTFWVMFEKQIHHLNVACFAGNIYFNVWRVVNVCTLDKIMPDCSLGNSWPTGFPTKWHLRNERRNSILRMRHYPDQGSASEWSCCMENLIKPISRSSTQIWVVMCHQYGISVLVSQMSFGRETSGSVAKCQLFSQANLTASHCSSFLEQILCKE